MELSVPNSRRPDLLRSVFLPLTGSVVLLFLALGLAALWSEKQNETKRLSQDVDAAVRLFEFQLDEDMDTMQVAVEPILTDSAVLDCFMAGDRDGLFSLMKERLDALHEQHGISNMKFVDADRVVFLRVHAPESHGDRIDRFTMLESQRTGHNAGGLELNGESIPMLRVVNPIRYGGRVVGYLEVGRDIADYAEEIRKTLGLDLHVLLRRDLVDEDDWVRAEAFLEHDGSWDRFDEYVAAGPANGVGFGSAVPDAVPSILQTTAEPEPIALPDGRHIAVGVRPLLDTSGEQVGLLLVSLDVTASVLGFRRTVIGFLITFVVFTGAMVLLLHHVVYRAQRGLRYAEAVERQAKAELEGRVQERTAQLQEQIIEREATEAQLRQAQKMEVIGQLIGGVAHDFNNLLAIIMSDLEGLRERLANDSLEELIEGAWEATERGTELVARLLAVSRKQPLSPRTVDANRLLQRLMPLLERTIPRNITIKTEYEPNLWECFVDPPQLENLILNLVINARDAMPQGGTLTINTSNRLVELTEAAEWAIAAGDYVKLTVTDTGTGMPSDVLTRAFDPFFTTKDVGKGSGLGLSMVHGTAKQSGGHVLLESTVGVGTTVRLLLPRVSAVRQLIPTPAFVVRPG
jgi:signal transduction histidine kinase